MGRWQPAGPVQAYTTYQVSAPVATHYRPATCEEVDCDAYRYGWVTVLDESTADGQILAGMLRRACRPVDAPAVNGTRRYVESRNELGETLFEFPAGQRCFGWNPTPKPVTFCRSTARRTTSSGVGTGAPHLGVERVHTSAEHWLDDFQANQAALAERIERG
jgi:hypothetical protein